MANSLQDQLLKAGLVSEAQVNRSNKQEHKSRKRGSGKRTGSEARAEARRRAQEKADKDRALNDGLEAERREKALRLQVRELILSSSQNDDKADTPYNVVKNGRIRRIYVTAQQREGLAAGRLAVSSARGRHHVISAEVCERVRALLPDYFVYHVTPEAPKENDEYAEYQVPDDLTW